MATQVQPSGHLGAARDLLEEIGPNADPLAKATAASAHATLVLAEQVAVVRVLLAGQAAAQRQVPGA